MKPLITKLILFITLTIFLALNACLVQTVETTIQPTITPTNLPTPKQGLGVVTGKLTHLDNSPIVGQTVRLAEVFYNPEGDGAFALDESFSPSTVSDSDGVYLFVDVKPGDYVLFVGSINTSYVIVSDPDGKAIVHKVVADMVTTLDPISIDFPR